MTNLIVWRMIFAKCRLFLPLRWFPEILVTSPSYSPRSRQFPRPRKQSKGSGRVQQLCRLQSSASLSAAYCRGFPTSFLSRDGPLPFNFNLVWNEILFSGSLFESDDVNFRHVWLWRLYITLSLIGQKLLDCSTLYIDSRIIINCPVLDYHW